MIPTKLTWELYNMDESINQNGPAERVRHHFNFSRKAILNHSGKMFNRPDILYTVGKRTMSGGARYSRCECSQIRYTSDISEYLFKSLWDVEDRRR